MKRLQLLLFSFLLFSTYCFSQNVSIPDPIFKQRIIAHLPVIDANGDGELQVTEAESFSGHLNVNLSGLDNIHELTGIEAFVNLTNLSAGNNSISTIDITENSQLHTLKIRNNLLISIDLSQNLQLRNLMLLDNMIEAIDLTNNALLEDLTIPNNNLTSIDVSQNPLLDSIQIGSMDLGVLDVSQNPLLERLTAVACNLVAIDLSANPNLRRLSLSSNPLTELNLNNNPLIRFLRLSGIDNLVIDFSEAPLLDHLIYTSTNVQVLDLSQNPAMGLMDIRGNQNLTYLNLKNGTNNMINISSTFPSNFTNLPSLETVCIDDVNAALAVFILDQVGHPVSFTTACTLGVDTLVDIKIKVYPNPSSDFITVESSQPFEKIMIFNIQGTRIKTYPSTSRSQTRNISEFKTGIYLLKIIGKETTTTKK